MNISFIAKTTMKSAVRSKKFHATPNKKMDNIEDIILIVRNNNNNKV